MTYYELMTQYKNFKYSINVSYDIRYDDKLANYIPTQIITDLLKDVFFDTIDNNTKNAARIFYGVYGSGKSHFTVVLASLLGKLYKNDNAIKTLLGRLELIDDDLSLGIKDFISQSKPYLIVTVDENVNGDFDSVIRNSTKKVLEANDITVSINNGSFKEAMEILKQWNSDNYIEARNKINSVIEKHRLTYDDFIKSLSSENNEALKIFLEIYKEVTCGIQFRPNYIKLPDYLDSVNEEVRKYGYRGIIFIFDEFGKYLEENIQEINIKHIQDMAEYCDHKHDLDNHLFLISHKQVMQYTRGLDRSVTKEWSKVESRFKSTSLEQDEQQFFRLIKHVIPKTNNKWTNFTNRFEGQFKKLKRDTFVFDLFKTETEDDFNEYVLYGAFPLHPVTAFLLYRLSKKIAQNERSVLTFLAGNEPLSLGDFLKTRSLEHFSFIGGDWIYDYFEPVLKGFKQGPEYEQYLLINSAFNKTDKKDRYYNIKLKIIKTLGILNIINDFELIKPDAISFINTIDENEKEINEALIQLEKEKVLLYSRTHKYYRFFDVSTFDVNELIEETISKQLKTNDIVRNLNEEYWHFPVLPNKYNEEYKMIRFFSPRFSMLENLEMEIGGLKERYLDGLLIYLLTNQPLQNIINLLQGERVIYLYMNNSLDIVNEVKKISAIKYLLGKENELKKIDPLIPIELRAYESEINDYINESIKKWSNPENPDVFVVHNGIVVKSIKNNIHLSSYMSEVMKKAYPDTLIVNNELVNKNTMSKVMIGYRKEICDKLLFKEDIDDYLDYKLFSGQYTFIRSILYKNMLLREKNNNYSKVMDEPEMLFRKSKAEKIMTVINEFLDRAKHTEVSFEDLYRVLKEPPYGLRDGYIPVLLTVAMRRYRHNIIIRFERKDQELNTDVLERMIRFPERYTLLIYKLPDDKEKYISDIEKVFKTYIDTNAQKRNRLMALYNGMLAFYKDISKLARSTNQLLTEETLAFRNHLQKDISDYRKLFFNDLLSLGSSFDDINRIIELAKEELENIVGIVEQELRRSLISVFGFSFNKPISSQLNKKYLDEWEDKKAISYDFVTNRFLDIVSKIRPASDDKAVIDLIAKLLTGFEVAYWGDNQINEFKDHIILINKKLSLKNNTNNDSQNGGIRISLSDNNGFSKLITISEEPLSQNAEILRNLIQSNVENFGNALTYEEQIKVVYEVIRKIL